MFSYRLRLPGGKAGVRELFLVCVALGDGVARDTIRRLLEQGDDVLLDQAPAGGSDDGQAAGPTRSDEAIRERLYERLRSAAPPADLAPALPASERTYQILVRSCAALARYAILVAVHRLLERGIVSEVVRDKLPAAELERPEPWMKEVAQAEGVLRGLWLRARAAFVDEKGPVAQNLAVRYFPRITGIDLPAEAAKACARAGARARASPRTGGKSAHRPRVPFSYDIMVAGPLDRDHNI